MQLFSINIVVIIIFISDPHGHVLPLMAEEPALFIWYSIDSSLHSDHCS